MRKHVQTFLTLACVVCTGADVYKTRFTSSISDPQSYGPHTVRALADLLLLRKPNAAFGPGAGIRVQASTQAVSVSHQRGQLGRDIPKMSALAVDKFPLGPSEKDRDADLSIRVDHEVPNGPDPFKLIEKELEPVSRTFLELIENSPILKKTASRFMSKKQGKQYHATAVAILGKILSTGETSEVAASRHLQLAQVTEMIHIANLVHEKVIDETEMEKIQMAVLAGDYLLSKASVALAGLEDQKVVELIASALGSTVEGRWMQEQQVDRKKISLEEISLDIDYYLNRTYLKTASLFSLGCKSSALLAGFEETNDIVTTAEAFGYHLGMTYQIVEDIIDFKDASEKPARAQREAYLVSAPLLYASEVEPSLKEIIQRSFQNDGDIQKAIEVAKGTDCIARSYNLAEFHAHKALDALTAFSDNDNKEALVILVHRVLSRR